MNILFLDAYYEPEIIAYTHLEKDIINQLIEDGNRITVICPIPTRGVSEDIKKEFSRKKKECLYNGNLQIKRFWAPQENRGVIFRAIRYFWCNMRTFMCAARLENIDIVFSNSTPPTQGFLSGLVAKKLSNKYKKKVPFVYNLQDIFPDSLINAGLTKYGSFVWKVGRLIENKTYNMAEKIIVISSGFKNNINNKGIIDDKIEIVSNWIDMDTVIPVDRADNKLIKEFAIDPAKFLVVYAGNFGETQGAEIIVSVAEKLVDINDIQFIVFGGGTRYSEIKNKSKDLRNIMVHPLLPQDRISEVYSLGDVALITCKKGTGKAGLPSKLWSIMACNTPVIASFDLDSDLSLILKSAQNGICVKPGDVDELKDAIIDEYNKHQKMHIKPNSLRSFVAVNASKSTCVSRFVQVLYDSVKGSR